MRPEYIPNVITFLRLLLIPPIIISLLVAKYRLGFFLFCFAGFTDAIDGYLARRFQWMSRFGAMVDPVADKLLIVLTFLTLGFIGAVPLWLLITVVLRDIVIVAGGTIYHFWIGEYEFKPTWISKCNTFLQILLIIVLMFQSAYWQYNLISPLALKALMILVFVTSVVSLFDYVIVWGLKAWRSKRKHN